MTRWACVERRARRPRSSTSSSATSLPRFPLHARPVKEVHGHTMLGSVRRVAPRVLHRGCLLHPLMKAGTRTVRSVARGKDAAAHRGPVTAARRPVKRARRGKRSPRRPAPSTRCRGAGGARRFSRWRWWRHGLVSFSGPRTRPHACGGATRRSWSAMTLPRPAACRGW